MSNRKKRHLSPAGFVLSLILLIGAIFAIDYLLRLFGQPEAENIVGSGGFSLAPATANEEEDSATGSDAAQDGAESDSNEIVLELTAVDLADGTLILADDTHPYIGSATFTDFSAVTNTNVRPRQTSLPIRTEILQPICDLFDGYATANGGTNLQIYSTLQTTLETGGLYSNTLPDRNTGYSFDIGLITSTGEVVPYIQKHNEWMLANVWQYGFVLRYPADKTDVTGVTYAPHHFRYVGQPHAAIMYANNFCMEEYIAYLQGFTMESGGYAYTYQDTSYLIYYIPADASGKTVVTLPADTVYTISGDNQSGYILTTTVSSPSPTDPAGTDGTPETTATDPMATQP